MKLSKTDKALHDEFSCYGKNVKEWMQKCIFMLPKIEKNRIWEKKRFGSIYEYAAKIAGMSQSKVDEALWVLHKIEDKPKLMKVAKKKGLHRIKPIANVATQETEEFWANKAMGMSNNVLRTYVRDLKVQELSGQNSWDIPGSPQNNGLCEPTLFEKREDKVQVFMKLDPEIAKRLNKLKGDENWNEFMSKFVGAFEKAQFEQELEAEKPQPVQTKSKHIPNPIQRFVKKRARGKCEHPNCKRDGKHLHHTYPFALKHEHDPDKIRYVCEEHHSIAHHGLIENEGQVPKTWLTRRKKDVCDFKDVINMRVAEFRR